MDSRYIAERAKDMLEDDLFAQVLTDIRLEALTELSECDPTDVETIRTKQALARATSEIVEKLHAIVRAEAMKSGGYSPNKDSDKSE